MIGSSEDSKVKVWLGYECFFDSGIGIYKTVVKVFGDEVNAMLWENDPEFIERVNQDYEWREYRDFEVE
jgi:hypothetical protein